MYFKILVTLVEITPVVPLKRIGISVADPGFPVGGRGLPRWLRFENFVCQNERIWTLGGGGVR